MIPGHHLCRKPMSPHIKHPIISAKILWYALLARYARYMRKANLSAYYESHKRGHRADARQYLDRHTLWTERGVYWRQMKRDLEGDLLVREFCQR